uniref:Protocadherin alpha 5 n=1 Tax=Ornithorhynchus anatinus TaxID=9258 RepID=F6W405_ORNAN
MLIRRGGGRGSRRRLLTAVLLLVTAWARGSGQLHYSVPEEAKHGTFVGRIAQDLGLEVGELVPRMFRAVSQGRRDYLEVNLQNGILFVNSRIDREELCGRSPACSIHLEVIVDKPLRVDHVEVEVKDINDNPPVFPVTQQRLLIYESRLPDSRFPLEVASDADIGVNSILTYRLSVNDHFALEVRTKNDRTKSVDLLLRKSLDREEVPEHHLVLTATDGGKPELTGSVELVVTVLDANDNAPQFDRSEYEVKLLENTANGTLVIRLNASDQDEGINKLIMYSFSNLVPAEVKDAFTIDMKTGEIRVAGELDTENTNSYEIPVEAVDKGNPPLSGHCKVLVEILDTNDNAPEIAVTSLSLPVREDALPGTVIALISVSDRDSGTNGQVTCTLKPPGPFGLVSTFKNYYSLVLQGPVDREKVAAYELLVTARDGGDPALEATASVSVAIADVNDNAPAFAQPAYTVLVKENNPPGSHIFTVSARDPDAQENALVSYSLVDRPVRERPLSSYVSVHAESGRVYALQPLDHEELELLQVQVNARDAGVPALDSNVTLQVFVLDENDNAPVVLPPHSGAAAAPSWSSAGSSPWSGSPGAPQPGPELVPQGVGAGHPVAKIRAVDLDSGYNAWLSYELREAGGGAGRSPFRIGLYTGEISTTRALDEADGPRHTLLVVVRDHGEPALRATATVSVSLVDSGQDGKAASRASGVRASGASGGGQRAALVDVNVYLIIAICAVSSLFVLTVLLYTALRCSAPPRGLCGPVPPALVCSSAVGSWSYSQQRRRQRPNACAGDGAAKSDLMAFSPNLPPCPGPRDSGEQPGNSADQSGKGPVDREKVAAYELLVTARDGGDPALEATASVSVAIADVNDNAPAFAQPVYTVLVKENNPPGSHIFTVTARDPDAQENALVSYSLVDRPVQERPLSSYVSVHAESGRVYALQPLDHEELELLQVQVNARDAGVPALDSNVTLQVFVLDENDNAPVVLPPHSGTAAAPSWSSAGSSPWSGSPGAPQPGPELVPQGVGAGHPVAKIRAVDLDSGYNAWLSYELREAGGGAGRSPFRIGLYTGEISTTRALDEADGPRHTLLVVVRDHGEPALRATATVSVSLVDSGQDGKAASRASGVRASGASGGGQRAALVDVNVYLIIAICAVSSLFVLTVLLYTALRCSAPPRGLCGPVPPALVCSSAVGSWSNSHQRRRQLPNACAGDGAAKSDLMAFSPNLPQLSGDNPNPSDLVSIWVDWVNGNLFFRCRQMISLHLSSTLHCKLFEGRECMLYICSIPSIYYSVLFCFSKCQR